MSRSNWEGQQGLIHRFGNKKFVQPTKRTLDESPVFEAFGSTDSFMDTVILAGCSAGLAVIVILLTWGLI